MDQSKDRLERLSGLLANKTLTYERISAVNGEAFVAETGFELPIIRHAWRRMTPSELGCLLSHIKFWSIVIERNLDYATVIEDDIHLSDNFGNYLARIAETRLFADRFDIVKFETTYDRIVVKKRGYDVDPFHLQQLKSTHYGTAGYSVNKKAASALLDYARNRDILADHIFIRQEFEKLDLTIAQVSPALVIQDKYCYRAGLVSDNLEPTITQNRHEKYKFHGFRKFKKEARRIFDQIATLFIRLHSNSVETNIRFDGEKKGAIMCESSS